MSDNYMTYSSWYMECNRHNFLSFETILGSVTPLTTQHSEKMKKMLLSCYTSAPKFMIKTFKAFVKPFESPQRSVKVKFKILNLNFLKLLVLKPLYNIFWSEHSVTLLFAKAYRVTLCGSLSVAFFKNTYLSNYYLTLDEYFSVNLLKINPASPVRLTGIRSMSAISHSFLIAYFDGKYLGKRLNQVGQIFCVPFFQKRVHFWPILNGSLIF